MEDVMNNPDLRGIVFSFFRTKPHKKCQNCKRVIMWNTKKTFLKYIEWENFISCNYFFLITFYIVVKTTSNISQSYYCDICLICDHKLPWKIIYVRKRPIFCFF